MSSNDPAPKPVRLVVSLLSAVEAPRELALDRLTKRFGPLLYLSEIMPFTFTHYYTAEMGAPLTRRVAAFTDLVDPFDLARIKRITDSLENDLAHQGKRRVNLDPGLLSESTLILASHKKAPHRVAILPGTYAELTLLYESGRFGPLPWTYPDYATPRSLDLFFHLRTRYLWQLNGRDHNPFPPESERPRRKQQSALPPQE